MRAVGLEEIGSYISGRQKTVAKYIATRPILDLCLDTERRPLLWTPEKWWEQEGLVFLGRPEEGWKGGDGGKD